MDPSQKQSEPLKQVSHADFAVRINRELGTPDDATKRNRENAGEALASIWHLRENKHFQWFWKECVEKEYQAAKDRYNEENISPENANTFRTQYLQMRRIVRFMLDREIEHRRLINPNDTEIARLREKLRLL